MRIYCSMNAGNTMVVSISRNEIPLIAIATYVTESNQVLLTTYTDVTRINILTQQILIYNPTKLGIEECQQEYICDIHKRFETLEICPLDRSKFNDKNFERFANSSIYEAIDNNYFLKSALTALVDFINIDCTSIHLTIKSLENRLRMDYQTIIDLNLVKNSANRKNLLNSIDYTHTSVGRRLLRENVIQPFADVDLITPRHEAIRFLSNNTEFAEGLSKLLSGFSALHTIMKNTSSIVSGMMKDEKSVIITAIKTFKMFDSISQLHDFLCRYKFDEHSLFTSLKKECKIIAETNVMEILERYLDLDYLKNCNTISIDTIVKCVKTSADPYLKLAVQIYTENIADLYNEITEIKVILPESVLHYDTKFGYTIKVKQDHLKLLADVQTQNLINKTENGTSIKSHFALERQNYIPRQQTHTSSYDHSSSTMSDIEFVASENALYNVQNNKSEKVQAKDSVSKDGNFRKKNATEEVEATISPIVLKRMGNHYIFTTESFERSNFRTLEGIEQVLQISHERCAQMIKEISIVHCKITELSRLIAELDVCCSLHLFSKFDDSCIPSFDDSVVISNTYHLLTEKRDRIKNNVYACPRMFFNIVTGANMSGKTTYMKMIAHNIILAQIGAPLRGKMAKIKIFKEILTRLSHDSGQTDNMSTFEKEVHMIKDILSTANKDSLVLLDEIGRGTNYEDGMSFALFVSKQLINKECFTYFTTHFVDIIKYLKNDAGVNVIKCQNWSIKSGVCEESNGIEICKDYFPEKMINDAKEVKKKIFGLSANVDFDNQIVQIALKIMGCTDEDERKELMLQLQK